MNTLVWTLQIILAVKLITVCYSHGLALNKPEMQEATGKMGFLAKPVLYATSVLLLMISALLILPTALNFFVWVTPFSAILLAFLLSLSIRFHVKYREKPKVFASLILVLITLLVVFGRWSLITL